MDDRDGLASYPLDAETLGILRMACGESEAAGCSPDPVASCAGCRLVYWIRMLVLDPFDAGRLPNPQAALEDLRRRTIGSADGSRD